jgi:hypothetical protein
LLPFCAVYLSVRFELPSYPLQSLRSWIGSLSRELHLEIVRRCDTPIGQTPLISWPSGLSGSTSSLVSTHQTLLLQPVVVHLSTLTDRLSVYPLRPPISLTPTGRRADSAYPRRIVPGLHDRLTDVAG